MNQAAQDSSESEAGGSQPAAELLPEVYDQLRQLAAARLSLEKPGQTLQATALVHEAWLRVAESSDRAWQNKEHFFAAAAEAMRRILIDNARRKLAQKRGGNPQRVDSEEMEIAAPVAEERLLAIDEALDGLAGESAAAAELVKLRFFAGLSHAEAAEAMGVSRSTADRTWVFARAWLGKNLKRI